MSYNYKMIIAYDGTKYCGWQIQPNGVSIQEIVQTCLSIALKCPIKIFGSGRTDTGVHATGQVAHFLIEEPVDIFRLLGSINGLLPSDIRVKEIRQVAEAFHSRFSATGKTYHYHLHLNPVQDPFKQLYCLHVKDKLDLDLLKQATDLFVGTHDFSAFANKNHTGSAGRDPIRTMYRLDMIEQEEGVRLEFEANGFLYRMVRTIAGTLLDVARGRKDVDDIPLIFEGKSRHLAGKAAPAHGLFLAKVAYPANLQTF